MLKRIAASVIIGTLLTTAIITPTDVTQAAATSQVDHFTPTKFKAVYLTAKSYLKIGSVNIVEGENGKAFVFTITVYNGENQTINLLDYWFRVKNKNGSSYKMKPANSNVKEVIPAKSNRDFTYYAEIDNNSKLSDILIDVIKWDFTLANYERKISSISIPTDYNNVTPYGRTQQFKWNNQLITTRLSKGLLAADNELQHVSLTWEITNAGSVPVKLSSTKFHIRTQDGSVYPIDYEAGNESIPAKGKKEYIFGTSIPLNVSLKNATLIWAHQPDSIGYGLPIVAHEIKTELEQLQVADVLKLKFNNQTLEAAPKQLLSASVTNLLNRLDITYEIINKGKSNVPLPTLAFEYKSANGSAYPMEIKENDVKSINPGISKSIELSVELPSSETQGKGSLYVYEIIKMNEKDVKRILGKHNVALTTQVTSDTSFGAKVDYTNTQGSYTVKVDKIFRSPWNNEDLIQAEIEVSNNMKESAAISIPDLMAGIYLDGVFLKNPVQIIKMNNGISINKGHSVKYLLITKIPYTQEFSNLKVEVKEKIGENTVKIAAFSGMNVIKQPEKYKLGKSILSQRIDKKSDISAKQVRVFEGRNSDMIYVDLELANRGIRVDQLTNWVGYFRNKAGMVFPAIINSTPELINPSGKVSTYAYAQIPKNVGFADFELLIGEGVEETGFANPTDQATGYIHPSIIELDYISTSPATTFEKINFYPYTFSMNRILASVLDERRFTLSFNYLLEQTGTAEKNLTKQDLLIEMIDENGKRYEQTLKFEEDLIQNGQQKKEIVIEDFNLFVNIPKFKYYELNVYEVINNHKRLIATKKLEWFITSS